ncbi:helix-turn-helix domain-containing protein [Tessaracoccus antarcticus]|uniref:helix-turn-helix domain-containing protein n=1 Tax=Tessaracoccus antarcticus TaxID=2479848 RepID=UPI0018F43779
MLLAAQGTSNAYVADLAGVSRPTVNLWRKRSLESGLDGLVDAQRPGRPQVLDDAAVLIATLTPPPKSLGLTHWLSRHRHEEFLGFLKHIARA